MILALLLFAAPVPISRPDNRYEVTPGRYVIKWSGGIGEGIFHKDGTYSHMWCEKEYRGKWEWDSKTRILIIKEKSEIGTTPYYTWKFVLKYKTLTSGSGSVDGSICNTDFFLTKNPKSIIINGRAKE